MLKWINNFFIEPILNFLYPPVCFLCNNLLENANLYVCINCWSQFKKVDYDTNEYLLLKERFNNEGIIEKYTSLYIFEKDGKFQEVIHLLKYKSVKGIGIKLGRELGKKIKDEFGNIDILTAIPLHKLKIRERGYNQVDFICQGITQELSAKFLKGLLKRTRYTKTQTELNFQERKENVKDAFCINSKYLDEIDKKNVLIVDDVITTGATITSAGKVLKDAGCKSVYAASAGIAML